MAFKVGALSFGGGFVIIPLMRADAVGRGWMTSAQFLNAVALGQITPGPVVQTVSAVGYCGRGLGRRPARRAGRVLPLVRLRAGWRQVLQRAAHQPGRAGVPGRRGPAAIGAILGSAILLAGALREPWQFAVLAAAAAMLLGLRRGVVFTLLAAAAAGLIVALAGGPLPH